MGQLALRTNGGTRLVPHKPVKVLELRREGEIGPGEVIYKVTPTGPVDLKDDDLVLPGQSHGVVPDNAVG
jgi:hypothetical protein